MRKVNAGHRMLEPYGEARLEFGCQHGICGRLRRTAFGLDAHRYGVSPSQGSIYDGRDRVILGLEEAARLRDVIYYDPDLEGLLLGYRGHVLGHKDCPLVPEDNHLHVRSVRCLGALQRDHPALLLGCLEVLDPALQVADLLMQEHVPGEEADNEQGCRSEREVSDAQILSHP